MLSLGVVQLLLNAAAGVVATVLHRRHEGAVDALPEPDRGTLRVLLTGQRIAVLLLLVVPQRSAMVCRCGSPIRWGGLLVYKLS